MLFGTSGPLERTSVLSEAAPKRNLKTRNPIKGSVRFGIYEGVIDLSHLPQQVGRMDLLAISGIMTKSSYSLISLNSTSLE